MSNITYLRGNIFESSAQVWVNPVNCHGVMGKGLALQFRKRFPQMYEQYRHDCSRGLVKTGNIHIHAVHPYKTPRWIINLPTKDHWRNPSRLEYIKSGLNHLTELCRPLQIESVAIPALG